MTVTYVESCDLLLSPVLVRLADLLLDDVALELAEDGEPASGPVLLVRSEPVQASNAGHDRMRRPKKKPTNKNTHSQ